MRVARARKALQDFRREDPDLPLALMMHHRRPRFMNAKERAAWRSLRDLADVYMPILPGVFRGNAPEWWCGVTYAEWSTMVNHRVTGIGRWVFPLYEPAEGDTNHVLRYRCWMRDRGIRGYGYATVPQDAGRGPYFGRLPAHVRRVDDVMRWPNDS
jgi:hypothetical protein